MAVPTAAAMHSWLPFKAYMHGCAACVRPFNRREQTHKCCLVAAGVQRQR